MEIGHTQNDCPYKPEKLIGLPIGMHHCPVCLLMVVAAIEHGEVASDCCGKLIDFTYLGTSEENPDVQKWGVKCSECKEDCIGDWNG